MRKQLKPPEKIREKYPSYMTDTQLARKYAEASVSRQTFNLKEKHGVFAESAKGTKTQWNNFP